MKLRLPTGEEVLQLLNLGLVLCVLALGGLGVFLAFSAAMVTAKVDYCYISANRQDTHEPVTYYITEHRPFANNAWAGPFETVEAALAAAPRLGCPNISVEP